VVNPFAAEASRQDLYARVQEMTGWQVTLLTARGWRNDYGQMVRLRRSSRYRGALIALPVLLNGNIPLHFYPRRLGPILARERADVTHVYHEAYGSATYQIFRAHRRVSDRPVGFSSQQNIKKEYPQPFRAMERFVYRSASFAIVVSEQVGTVLRAKGYAGSVDVVPNGIDSHLFTSSSAHQLADEAALRVGFIGRLVPEKGVDTLLEAASRLRPSELRIVIAGKGPDEDRLRNLAVRLGLVNMIEWVGYVRHEDTPHFFATIDVLAVPSKTTPRWKEQFGRVVIEATASGVAVVASDSGELPRVVRAAGGGWIFREGDAQALASVLEWMQGHRREVDGVRAAARIKTAQEFDEEAVALRYVNAIQRVLASEPPS
jgi:glycosyltransferase involved in cell wall biosynthesis